MGEESSITNMRPRCLNSYNWEYKCIPADNLIFENSWFKQDYMIPAVSWQLIIFRLEYDYLKENNITVMFLNYLFKNFSV